MKVLHFLDTAAKINKQSVLSINQSRFSSKKSDIWRQHALCREASCRAFNEERCEELYFLSFGRIDLYKHPLRFYRMVLVLLALLRTTIAE